MSIDCVILAAGYSSRMGRNKMTLELDGSTVLERCMEAFYVSCTRIIVVTGKYHTDIKRLLKPYAKVHIAYNASYSQGMFSSVKEGIRHVESKRFFITPGDYPLIKPQTIDSLINTKGRFAVPVCKGESGHPILLDRLFIPAILASDHISLRGFLRGMTAHRQEVRVDDIGIVTDIDTVKDFKAVTERAEK